MRDKWDRIIQIYAITKSLFIECEETDPELKTNLQPLNEQKAVLDHVIRMMYSSYSPNLEEEFESNYKKAIGHLCRAFYDVSDMLSINIRNKISELLAPYTSDEIRVALPEYYSTLKPEIESINKAISAMRNKKGISIRDDADFNMLLAEPEDLGENEFEDYYNKIIVLKEIYIRIQRAVPSLEDIHKRQSKTKKREHLEKLIFLIIGAVITAVVTIIIAVLRGGS